MRPNSAESCVFPDRVIARLGPLAARLRVEAFGQIDSTSDELRRRAERGDIDGQIIVAETQSAGRGRHGRAWVDRPGGSLLFSVGWRAPVTVTALAGLSLAAGVAICEVLEAHDVSAMQLKWPNDLLHRHCKVGGILVETAAPGNAALSGTAVVIGIGLNVVLDAAVRDAVAAPVTDLRAAGWTGDRNTLLAEILLKMAPTLDTFAAEGFQPFRAAWLSRHALQQRNVTIWRAGREIASGRAIDVDRAGALLLQTPAGVRRLLSGELTLRPG
jgi:BirA family biotin operon repressor/biotin-[acetyl-CoA-carboxylase] ligase